MFLLSLSSCGYKAPPYYLKEKTVDEDENAEFILKQKTKISEN
jgi:hypothetical protein